MIIRSQDKKKIYNFEQIRRIFVDANMVIADDVSILGEYSTEEKAIKVLDMIQNAYTQYGTIKDGFGSIRGAFNIPKCFQMPSDEDVEV